MPYKLRDRLTQEDWFNLLAAGLMDEEDIERAQAAGPQTWGWDDFKFLHEIGALDWTWAGMMIFQHFIDVHGTTEEKIRLENMKVGYRWRRSHSALASSN
jgi:hypothetical protein